MTMMMLLHCYECPDMIVSFFNKSWFFALGPELNFFEWGQPSAVYLCEIFLWMLEFRKLLDFIQYFANVTSVWCQTVCYPTLGAFRPAAFTNVLLTLITSFSNYHNHSNHLTVPKNYQLTPTKYKKKEKNKLYLYMYFKLIHI